MSSRSAALSTREKVAWAVAIAVLLLAAGYQHRDHRVLQPLATTLLVTKLRTDFAVPPQDNAVLVVLQASDCAKSLEDLADVTDWAAMKRLPILGVVEGSPDEVSQVRSLLAQERIALPVQPIGRRNANLLLKRTSARVLPAAILVGTRSKLELLRGGRLRREILAHRRVPTTP